MATVELNEIAIRQQIEPIEALENLVIIGLKFYRERSAA
jgi:hypothetical protein